MSYNLCAVLCLLILLEVFAMATKSVSLDELERSFISLALNAFEAVLKRKLNAETNPDVRSIRERELAQLAGVKGKVLS